MIFFGLTCYIVIPSRGITCSWRYSLNGPWWNETCHDISVLLKKILICESYQYIKNISSMLRMYDLDPLYNVYVIVRKFFANFHWMNNDTDIFHDISVAERKMRNVCLSVFMSRSVTARFEFYQRKAILIVTCIVNLVSNWMEIIEWNCRIMDKINYFFVDFFFICNIMKKDNMKRKNVNIIQYKCEYIICRN